MVNVKERLKGFFGIVIAAPIAITAISTVGTSFAGLGAGVQGIGRATQSLVATGFLGGAAKLSGATNLFKSKKK